MRPISLSRLSTGLTGPQRAEAHNDLPSDRCDITSGWTHTEVISPFLLVRMMTSTSDSQRQVFQMINNHFLEFRFTIDIPDRQSESKKWSHQDIKPVRAFLRSDSDPWWSVEPEAAPALISVAKGLEWKSAPCEPVATETQKQTSTESLHQSRSPISIKKKLGR